MEIWLKQGKKKLKIPVLPSEYTVTESQGNNPVVISGLGEINLLGKPNLAVLSFASFFPKRKESYVESGKLKRPKEYIEMLRKMKKGSLKVLITGTPINMWATIEEFEWGENDRTGDIRYSISLKEYKKISIPESTLEKEEETPQGADRPQPEQAQTVSYTVKSGDCLSAIAQKLTGSANWKPIYEQNKGVIGGNPNKIKPGQVLIIPGAKG